MRSSIDVVASVVGHELRGPISAALILSQVVDQEIGRLRNSEAARSLLGTLTNELRRLDGLLSRVVELELHGKPFVQARHVDLGRSIRDAIARSLFNVSGRDIVIEQRDDLVGWWDDIAVAQIIENLLSNALKFGDGLPIRVVFGSAGNAARIEVQDHGKGIHPRDHQRVFRRGVRSPPSEGGGLGLGLWLVKALAKAHGGYARVDARARAGATFIVRLPQRYGADLRQEPG